MQQMDVTAEEKQNENIRKRIVDVEELRVTECPSDSPWIRPVRIHYRQDGERRDWDVVRAHDGVSIIIFNTDRRKLVFVRQFRPAFFYTYLPEKRGPVNLEQYPPTLGLTLELCAGIVDKDKSLVEIARDEVREECGYEAPSEAFKYVITFRYVSTSVCKHTLYYAEVTDEMHIHSVPCVSCPQTWAIHQIKGGGSASEGELIEVVELSIPEVKEYVAREEVESPPCLLYGITWFLANKPQHCC